MGFIRFIVIVVIIFLAFRLIFRYLIPWLLKRYVTKMGEGMSNHQQNQGYEKTSKDGSVIIDPDQSSSKNKKIDDNEGEYISFEEVDD